MQHLAQVLPKLSNVTLSITSVAGFAQPVLQILGFAVVRLYLCVIMDFLMRITYVNLAVNMQFSVQITSRPYIVLLGLLWLKMRRAYFVVRVVVHVLWMPWRMPPIALHASMDLSKGQGTPVTVLRSLPWMLTNKSVTDVLRIAIIVNLIYGSLVIIVYRDSHWILILINVISIVIKDNI